MGFNNKTSTISIWVFSLLFSVINIVIYFIDSSVDFSDRVELLIMLVDILILSIAIYKVVYYLIFRVEWKKILFDDVKTLQTGCAKYYFIVSAIQLFAWIPVLCSYYPGITVYDYPIQIVQTVGSYSTHHPLIHTLYIKFFNEVVGGWLKDTDKGIFIGTLVQMIVFSLMLSTGHLYLKLCHVKKRIRITCVVVACVWPFVSLIAIANIKDVFFTGFMLVTFVLICAYHNFHDEYIQHKWCSVIYTVSVCGMILFRNNGKYVVVATLLWIVVAYIRDKDLYKSILVCTLIGIIFGSMANTGLKKGLDASEGSINEALSIPYQQMAAVYVYDIDSLSAGEIAAIEKYLPTASSYIPNISDYVKGYATADEDLPGFVKLWATLGVHHPKTYIKSFFELDAGYLGVTNTSFAYIKENGLIETTPEDEHSLSGPGLFTLYEKLFTNNSYIHGFILRNICKPAIYVWSVLLLFILSLVKKRYNTTIAFVFLGTFILTLIAGPCVLVRYIMPCVVCLPCYVCLLFFPKGVKLSDG